MKDFYEIMRRGDNFKTAQSLMSMLEELVAFRRDNIIESFKEDSVPFGRVWSYLGAVAVFDDLMWKDAHLTLDVRVAPDGCLAVFWDRNDAEGIRGRAKLMLEKMGWLEEFKSNDGGFQKSFKFPSEEEDLFERIRLFMRRASDVLTQERGTDEQGASTSE